MGYLKKEEMKIMKWDKCIIEKVIKIDEFNFGITLLIASSQYIVLFLILKKYMK